jgi:glycosyltransferase involved in cell wall biosynthesis
MTPRRTRVLYVINDLARAGAETQMVGLLQRLPLDAYEPRVVLLKSRNDFRPELEARGIAVVPLDRRGWWDLGVVARLRAEGRRFQPDIVHSWLFLANLHSAAAFRGAARPRLILSQRCSYEATVPAFWRGVARWSHRQADAITVNSSAALEEEVRSGHPRDRLHHVPNGVATATGPTADRTALDLPPGPLVVSLGQLERIKGHHVLVEAWAHVRERHPTAHLVLVGDGPRRAALEARVRALGLARAVTFAGYRSPATPWLAAADVLVQPSLTEGMPNAVLEAMGLGRPVVASAVGGIPELVENETSGLLVPSGDPEALARALGRLLESEELRQRFGQAGRERVLACFSYDRAVEATTALYRALSPRGATASTAAAISTGPIVTP